MTLAQPHSGAPKRTALIKAFLADAGWAKAARAPLAGDASARRYERLTHPEFGPAVLMDADPLRGEDTRPFVRVANHLRGLELSAPRLLASDFDHGLLLLEDLGDDLFARLTAADLAREPGLYAAAIDLLAVLHRAPPPNDVPRYGPEEMAPLAALATQWYAPPQTDTAAQTARKALADACHDVLTQVAAETNVLVLRDYHAENLLWLPARSGEARVGLLDFQDAASGHAGYDVVSLLADARRDVTADTRTTMMRRYMEATGREDAQFAPACAALSAQRNLRILGVFARLSLRDAKTGYLSLIPRVWDHLQRDLAHPVCAPIRTIVETLLPAPSDAWLATLKERAGTCPTR